MLSRRAVCALATPAAATNAQSETASTGTGARIIGIGDLHIRTGREGSIPTFQWSGCQMS
jgi:hypothetical protein